MRKSTSLIFVSGRRRSVELARRLPGPPLLRAAGVVRLRRQQPAQHHPAGPGHARKHGKTIFYICELGGGPS